MSTNDKLADALRYYADDANWKLNDGCLRNELNVLVGGNKPGSTVAKQALAAHAASLAAPPAQGEWQPIETAPKEVGKVVMLGNCHGAWAAQYMPVYGSGWRSENPWTSMMLNHEHMRDAGGVLNHAPATHWKPWPAAAPQPAPAPVHPCTMGVGCEEAGVCYASANGQPEQCGAHPPAPAPAADGAGNHVFHLTNIRDQVSQDGLADSDYQVSAIDAAIAALAQQRVPDAVRELRDLYRAYVKLLEAGRDRILDLGGTCDPVDQMERVDPYLIRARRAIEALATIDQQQEARGDGE